MILVNMIELYNAGNVSKECLFPIELLSVARLIKCACSR